MLLCIALPLVSVLVQSVHTPHDAVLIETKNCGPFGCKMATSIDQDATAALRESQPLGEFVGADIFLDRGHLAISEVADTWRSSDGLGPFFAGLGNLPFYRAMGYADLYICRDATVDHSRSDDRASGQFSAPPIQGGGHLFLTIANDRLAVDWFIGAILDD